MSALGHKQTYAVQQPMSALPPIATAKADFRTTGCQLYPQERTCAVQLGMSALGQKRTSYSMISSARSKKVTGIGRPISLAALRFTTSLNRVGFCTARSEGLAPLRIRST